MLDFIYMGSADLLGTGREPYIRKRFLTSICWLVHLIEREKNVDIFKFPAKTRKMYVDFLKYYFFCRFYFSAIRNYVVWHNFCRLLNYDLFKCSFMYKNQTQNVDIKKSMFSFHLQQVEIFIVTFWQIFRLFAFSCRKYSKLNDILDKIFGFYCHRSPLCLQCSPRVIYLRGVFNTYAEKCNISLVINWITLHFHRL